MMNNRVSTDDAERKVQALEWEIEQHKKLETTIAEVFNYLRSVMGETPDGTDGDVKLDIGARRGLNFILSQAESLLYHANCGTFFMIEGQECPYGFGLANPYKAEKV